MRAVKLRAPGGLDRLDMVNLDEPGTPGPGEIRVRIHANSLNYHDYAVALGLIPAADGRIPMSDGAGVVEAVGEGVTELVHGDAVVSCFFPLLAGRPAAARKFFQCAGDGIDGYARETVVCPGHLVYEISQGLQPRRSRDVAVRGAHRLARARRRRQSKPETACSFSAPAESQCSPYSSPK